MIKNICTVLVTTLISLQFTVVQGQKLSVNWSQKQNYENKLDGFFDGYIGANSKYLYAKYADYSTKKLRGLDKRINIFVFDKKTMKKVASKTILDVKNEGLSKKYEDKKYYKSIVFEKYVYIFWTKESKEKIELYAESYSEKLKPVMRLKKVYELKSGARKDSDPNFVVMGNKDAGERIMIGGERAAKKGKSITFEYKLLDKEFKFSDARQIELPVIVTGRSSFLSSSYELGDDFNLHIETYVTLSKEEGKTKSKGESWSYPIYSVLDLKSGDFRTYPIKFDNKNIFDFDMVIDKDKIKIFGFFCDLTKDRKGNDTHGIFYGVLDSRTKEITGLNFTYFTKTQLRQLFARDLEDDVSGKKKKKKKKGSTNTIARNYTIEVVKSVDEDNLVLFCSRMQNYSVTTCNSEGSCTTRYYCKKSNVTVFKISSDGTLLWSQNLDRFIEYKGWDVYDLTVAYKNGKFYVAYGSNYAINAEKKKGSTKKSKRYKKDRFEYAIFDYETGQYFKKEYTVNKLDTPKKDRKVISATNLAVVDDEIYASSTKVTMKPIGWICACTCIPFFMPSLRRGFGYIGRVVIE